MQDTSHISAQASEAPRPYLFLGVVSFSLLAYQLLVTRVLSTLLLYHYAFLVAAFSILGMALGALAVDRMKWLERRFAADGSSTLLGLGLTLVALYCASGAVLAFSPSESALLYAIASATPYVVGGMALTLLLKSPSLHPGQLYAWDLLGATAGTLAAILSLDYLGMLRSWALLLSLSLLACLLVRRVTIPRVTLLALLLGPMLLAVALCPRWFNSLEMQWPTHLRSPHKLYGKLTHERGPGALKIVRTSWDSFSRTDVIELRGEPDRKAVTIDGVAYSAMLRFNGNLEQLRRYPDDSGYLPSIGDVPFAYGPNATVLALGSGAGRDLLYAIAHGSQAIDAVEINRGSIHATRHYGVFNGQIYDRPEVQVYAGDARSFIERSQKKYDLILLTLIKTEAIASLGLSLAEDYLLTREAFTRYLEHLSSGGRLALFVHHEPALAKATATALLALESLGIARRHTPDHIAVFNSRKLDPHAEVYQPLLLVSRSPIAKAHSIALAVSAESHDNLPGYLPQLREEGRLLDVKSGTILPDEFPKDLPYNAAPATDDSPFFYRFDTTFQELFTPALVAAVVLCILLSAPLMTMPGLGSLALYFAGIGFGFMAIETIMVQRLILYLGHPTIAFALAISGLLLGGSLGSFLTGTNAARQWLSSRAWTALLISSYLLLLRAVTPLLPELGVTSLVGRCAVGLALLMPLGCLLGTLLPLGALRARLRNPSSLSLLLALNGAAGVLGTIAAVCMSMYEGYRATMVMVALLYVGLFLMPRTRGVTI